MSRFARTTGQRGISTLELTMATPLVVFAMLLLIGMGHALISKQHAMVGGQFAAHHQRIRETAPDAAAISRVVSGRDEAFRLSGGGGETISYTASAIPRKGLIARALQLKATTSQYQTPQVSNACVPRCKLFDSFAKLLSPELITGIIFSGNSSSLSKDDLLSIVAGKGKKNRRQKPAGAVAVSPGRKAPATGDPGKGAPPTAGGAGGGKPPRKPPAGGGGVAGTGDDDRPDGNGRPGGNGQPEENGGNGGQPGDRRRPIGAYIPAPRSLPAFPGAQPVRPKTPVKGGGGLRRRWKDQKGNIYEWDSENGRVEKYDKRGRHLGEFDPDTGEQTKPAEPTRRVEP